MVGNIFIIIYRRLQFLSSLVVLAAGVEEICLQITLLDQRDLKPK